MMGLSKKLRYHKVAILPLLVRKSLMIIASHRFVNLMNFPRVKKKQLAIPSGKLTVCYGKPTHC